MVSRRSAMCWSIGVCALELHLSFTAALLFLCLEVLVCVGVVIFFFNDAVTSVFYTLSLRAALPIFNYRRVFVYVFEGAV